MENNEFKGLVTKYFDFFFDLDQIKIKSFYNEFLQKGFLITHPSGSFEFAFDKYTCAMFFWPNFDKRENAITIENLYEFYINKGVISDANKIKFISVNNINKEVCLQEKSLKLLAMIELFNVNNLSWWDAAKSFSQKRQEILFPKHSH